MRVGYQQLHYVFVHFFLSQNNTFSLLRFLFPLGREAIEEQATKLL